MRVLVFLIFTMLISVLGAREVSLRVEWFEMDAGEAVDLLDEFEEGVVLYQAVKEKVKEGEARRVTLLMHTGKWRTTWMMEGRQEVIYATEYEPAEIFAARGEIVAPAATAFETRHVGEILEAEVTKKGGGALIRLILGKVTHTRDRVISEWKEDGEKGIVMPEFYALNLETELRLLADEVGLATMVSPKGDDGKIDFGRKQMVFVRYQELKGGEE